MWGRNEQHSTASQRAKLRGTAFKRKRRQEDPDWQVPLLWSGRAHVGRSRKHRGRRQPRWTQQVHRGHQTNLVAVWSTQWKKEGDGVTFIGVSATFGLWLECD